MSNSSRDIVICQTIKMQSIVESYSKQVLIVAPRLWEQQVTKEPSKVSGKEQVKELLYE
jgi:hypothetical protein